MYTKKVVLFVELVKIVYRCIKSACVFWEDLSTNLSKGFILNHYTCMANKTSNGSHRTIMWYIDNLKLICSNHKVVTRLLEALEKVYIKMAVTLGKIHIYIGMVISFYKCGVASIYMYSPC